MLLDNNACALSLISVDRTSFSTKAFVSALRLPKMSFLADFEALKAALPTYITNLSYSPERLTLTIETVLSAPHNQVSVLMSKEYVEMYPKGEIHFLVGHTFNSVSVGSHCNLRDLCRTVHEVACIGAATATAGLSSALSPHEGMGGPSSSTEWAMEPTVEFNTPSSGYGGFYPQMSPALLEAFGATHAVMNDNPAINQCDVSLLVDLSKAMSPEMAASLHFVLKEKLQLRFRFDREKFLDAHVEVFVGQEHNFKTGIFFGLVGQLQQIAQRYCETLTLMRSGKLPDHVAVLMKDGFLEADVREASPDGVAVDEADLRKRLLIKCSGRVVPYPTNFMTPSAFFNSVLGYLEARIPTVSDHCVICDRGHEFGSGMLGSSVCLREVCSFQFQTLHVAKDITDSISIQTGVVDLLINFAKAASSSSRWQLIFKPFPHIFDERGAEVLTEQAPVIDKAREILLKIPKTQKLMTTMGITAALQAAHPLANAMFKWVIASNKSVITKLAAENLVPFMGTPHQFALVTTSDERLKRFEALKAKHGAEWVFHGSNHENWHSILRNGLKNASGTKLQANGAAFGSGIYLSPDASVSFGYSQLGGDSRGSVVPATEAQFIELESMHCIAICEVAKKDLRKNNNIWVQPDEDAVVTRFFFVYTRGLSQGYHTKLEDTNNIAHLNALGAKLFNRQK
jgi:hypothetical protein